LRAQAQRAPPMMELESSEPAHTEFVICNRTIDRLLLGLKGTMSEAELHVLKQRLHQGKLGKARRGELTFALPIGYLIPFRFVSGIMSTCQRYSIRR
jgi:hypothetical protein